jgi:tyrosyl-tRNA synthetase
VSFGLGADSLCQTPKFLQELCSISHLISANDAFRSADCVVKTQKEDQRTSSVLYSLFQMTDMKCLRIDLAIGAVDQRKIHMLYKDRIDAELSVIHIPLLLSGGLKISKSDVSTADSLSNIKNHLRGMSRCEAEACMNIISPHDDHNSISVSISDNSFAEWGPFFEEKVLMKIGL